MPMNKEKDIESIYLEKESVADILLTVLEKSNEYNNYLQSIVESIVYQEEASCDE